ncbi:MAG: hypothetical protein EBS27_01215 [Actinobacteria bacterium]|nr:hypothetical protein [Actinomycetota bacterium]
MNYFSPDYADLGGIGAPMNPLLVQESIAFGPTRVMDVPQAGYAILPSYGLDGRHGGSDFFAPGQWELSGWREALEVFTAASFLFPE